MPTTIYRSRSRVARNRLLAGAAVVTLVVGAFLVGRGGSDAPAVSAPPAPPPASARPSPEDTPASPEDTPVEPPPSSAAAVTGIDAYQRLEAESADARSGVEVEDTGDVDGGQNVGWVNNGDWLRFDGIDFGATPPTAVNLRVASESSTGGRLEIRLDSPTVEPSATLTVSHTGGWQNWRTETTTMAPATGVHTVFVTFGSDRPDDFLNVNWLTFRR